MTEIKRHLEIQGVFLYLFFDEFLNGCTGLIRNF